MYLVGVTNDNIYQYNLATAFEVSTAKYVAKFGVVAQDTQMSGIILNASGSKFVLVGNGGTSGAYDYDMSVVAGANALYSNNITIIGQDDASGLNQPKSKSQEKYGVLTISNPSTLGDGDFLAIGDNGQNATTFVSDSTSDTYGTYAGYQRLSRLWKVQSTGTPGTVKIEVDINDPDLDLPNITGTDGKLYVLRDGNINGLFNDLAPILMYDDGTNGDTVAGDNIWTRQFANAFTNNEVFTFAQLTPVMPGGVSNNIMTWYKADSGVYDDALGADVAVDGDGASLWQDKSGNSRNSTASSGTLTYKGATNSQAINFNPAIDFDGTNDFFTVPSTTLPAGDTQYTTRAVYVTDLAPASSSKILFGFGTATSNQSVMLGTITNNEGAVQDNWFGITGEGVTPTLQNVPSLIGGRYAANAGTDRFMYYNGRIDNSTTSVARAGTLSATNYIGQATDGSSDFDGRIAEIVTYNTSLSTLEETKLDSYLAFKYGITALEQGNVQSANNVNAVIEASVGQTITAPSTGYISDITLKTGATTANGSTGILSLCNGAVSAATCVATPTYTQAVNNIPTAVSTTFTIQLSTTFPVTSASSYTFVLTSTSGTNINLRGQNTDVYAGGIKTGSPSGDSASSDLFFAYSLTSSDYLASDGTTKMWDATVAGIYNQDIAGF
jgi:hypothetical protein